jgi:2-oxo-3-hexenedioate decarboxylase
MNKTLIAENLRQAMVNRTPVSQISHQYPEFSLKDALEVQELGFVLAQAAGECLCGYKMGLTSKAKQRDVNVFEPIRGYLLKSFEIPKNGTLAMNARIHPRVEPEVAVVLKNELKGPGVTLRDVVSSLEAVYPALEIVDSRYEGFIFKLEDVIADNTSAAGFMVGRVNLLHDLDRLNLMGISVRKNGAIVETGAPAAVLGDPLLSVVSLANSLAEEARSLPPGYVILTGGITQSVSFQKGDRIEVEWPQEVLAFTAE